MNKLLSQAAASVDATPALVPVLSDLFAGIDSLGSSPQRIVRMLRTVGAGDRCRLLDLGCGKGAAVIEIARTLGCRCTGIDAVPEFIDEARREAARRAVDDRCDFQPGDIQRVRFGKPFDVAIMLGVFDVIRGRRLLRRHLKPGGVYIIDDAVSLKPRRGWVTIDQAREALGADGDEILAEDVWTPAQTRRQEERLYQRMSRNAAAIIRAQPRLRRPLGAFLERQRAAATMLRTQLRAVQWMVRVRR